MTINPQTVSIRPAFADEVFQFLQLPVRPEDEAEWLAMGGVSVAEGLRHIITSPRSRQMRAVLCGNLVVALFGIQAGHDGKNYGWLVGADLPIPMAIGFLAVWKDETELARQVTGGHPIYAVADERNPQHHLWLKAMGWTRVAEGETCGVDPAVPFTTYKLTFEE